MSIIEYSERDEAILRAVLDRLAYAERKHPGEKTFDERWRVVHKELWEARECLAVSDFDGAVQEYLDAIAPGIRAVKQLMQHTGARLWR